jgi:chromosomal replication initiation ATPase DnaA
MAGSPWEPGRTFAALVVGAANQLAVAAAKTMAESPHPPFTPLLIQGGIGLGKTHLLQAIGQRRLEVDARAVVRYTTWRALIEGWRAAHALGRGAEFLAPEHEADLLLVDEVEAMVGPGLAPDAVLDLLAGRQEARRATALASRVGMERLAAAGERALRLLGSGLVVELGQPDAAMRWDILHRRSQASTVPLSPAVLQAVAAIPLDSIRELVAAADRLVAFQAVSGVSLEPAQARVLVTGVVDEPAPDTGVRAVAAPPPHSPLSPRAVAARSAGETDEFSAFLSDVVAGVAEQVDQWRARVAEAVVRYQAAGYRTRRLESLLDQDLPAQPDAVLQRFGEDVERLRHLLAEVRELDPDLAAHEAFRDPDQVEVAEALVEQARTRDLAARAPQAHLRLEELVEGASNRSALEAVRAVIAEPGAGPNPLLLVGGSGVGKTHLLHGLGNALVERGLRGVVCLSALAFDAELQAALEADRAAAWRRPFHWASALLLDDIQHLAGRGAAQEELTALLDRMLDVRRPVVVTSSVPAAELAGLSPQLLTRLGAGLVVEISRPDRELRLGVVRQLLHDTKASDAAALADYLASRPAGSVRAVHAMVQRVLRAAEAGGVEPTPALARQVLDTAAHRRAGPGQLGSTSVLNRLREKLVDDWPEAAQRFIEDLG